MQSISDNSSVSIDDKVFAIRVLGNMAFPQSLSFLRAKLLNIMKFSSAKSEHLIHDLLTFETLRNFNLTYTRREVNSILIDCLTHKADNIFHLATIIAFFDTDPYADQISSFEDQINRHDLTAGAIKAFEMEWVRAIKSHNRPKFEK